jgi:hypothetical protein
MGQHTTLRTIHGVDIAKLATVKAEMSDRGIATIRVVDCGDYYQALEGTHRIAAAAALGMPLDLTVLAQDALVDADSLDWQDLCGGEQYAAGDLAGEISVAECGVYRLADDAVPTEIFAGRP